MTLLTKNLAGSIGAESLVETSGPTTLTIGDIADGKFLKRSGTEVVGDTGAVDTDEKASVSANDTTPGYLVAKVLGTANEIVATETDDASNETLVLSAGANLLQKTLYDANTILAADTDNTPAAVTVAEKRIVGRASGGNIAALTAAQVMAILELQRDFVSGMQVKRTSATQVTIGTGIARSDDDTENIQVTSLLTAAITSTGANGRNSDTAEAADKWYGIYVIKNVTSGAVASFLINEDDVGGFTYPTGYTVKRRVGWIYNDTGSNFRPGNYAGLGGLRLFLHDEEYADLTALDGGTSATYADVDLSEFVPPTSEMAKLNLFISAPGGDGAYIRQNGSSATDPPNYIWGDSISVATAEDIATDSSQVIEYKVDASAELTIYVRGFFDEL